MLKPHFFNLLYIFIFSYGKIVNTLKIRSRRFPGLIFDVNAQGKCGIETTWKCAAGDAHGPQKKKK